MRTRRILGVFIVITLILSVGVISPTTVITAGESNEGCVECNEDTTYPIMRPDRETLDRWNEGLYNLRIAPIRENNLSSTKLLTLSGDTYSHSLLSWVPYVPGDRHQGSCGNCWVWASTGCMEITHLKENDVYDRISIQFVNSAYGDGDGEDFACCGGWMGDFASFYSAVGYAVPWDNFNADWHDGNNSCGGVSNVHIDNIVKAPRYNISYIEAFRIATHDEDEVDQATAIAYIKSWLDANYGVYFSFKLPNGTAWTNFQNFWNNEPDTAIWGDFSCGADYDEDTGGGHGMLCVGYNDEEGTANDYWIMLNSWGTPTGRPDGTMRVAMNIDYSCELDGLGGLWDDYSLNWLILEVDFPNHAPKADAGGPYTAGEGTQILFDASGSTDPDGHALEYAWDFDDDGLWDTGWETEPTITHKWCDDYTGTVRLIVKEISTDEQLTDTDSTTVTVTNVAPTVDAGLDQTVNE
ncbi:MAG TPA: hypothetical protein G4O15_02585, partial [Dehalococcoidia bacterium]|nr:hypothetical protein [Dehalococcoidia bacterium]